MGNSQAIETIKEKITEYRKSIIHLQKLKIDVGFYLLMAKSTEKTTREINFLNENNIRTEQDILNLETEKAFYQQGIEQAEIGNQTELRKLLNLSKEEYYS